MAEKEYKQMQNKVTIQGTLMDSTLEVRLDKKGRKYISGELEIMTDNDYVIPISVFSYELKSSGEKNNIYTQIEKIIDTPNAHTVGITKASKIAVTSARLEDNSFFSDRDNRVVSNWRISGSFIRAAASDAINLNNFEVQGVISSIKEVVTRSGDSTDTYDLKLLNVGYGNRVNELTFRFDDKDAIKYINNNYNVGDLVTLCGQVIYEQQENVVEKELGFGEQKQTYTNTIRLLRITAGTQPISEDESEYDLKGLQNILHEQNNDIIERHNAQVSTVTSTGKDLLF